MMIKWVPVNEVEIPEIENPGFSEDVIIREPIAMVKKEKIETVKDVKKDESNEIFADFYTKKAEFEHSQIQLLG